MAKKTGGMGALGYAMIRAAVDASVDAIIAGSKQPKLAGVILAKAGYKMEGLRVTQLG